MQFVNTRAEKPANPTRSLQRAVTLLRLLASHTRTGWRLSDLAQQTGLDPATVHRLLNSLCDEGLATRVADSRRYTLGALAFELGIAAAPYFDLGRPSHERLAALARELRGTLFLKIRSGMDSVCLARHDGVPVVASLMLDVGGRRPLCLTAGGVAMVVPLPPSEQLAIEAHNRHSIERQDTQRWRGVSQMLARSRPRGFALNLGDIAAGISAVGVALPCAGHATIASLTLAVAGPILREDQADKIADRLRAESVAMAPLLAQLRL